MLGLDGWKLLILLVLATVLIGPDRLPEYVGKLRQFIRQARDMADGAKSQLKEQIGPEYEEINWRQYDPRQYDPRQIIRQALWDDDEPATTQPAVVGPDEDGAMLPAADPWDRHRYDADRPTPYDIDAT